MLNVSLPSIQATFLDWMKTHFHSKWLTVWIGFPSLSFIGPILSLSLFLHSRPPIIKCFPLLLLLLSVVKGINQLSLLPLIVSSPTGTYYPPLSPSCKAVKRDFSRRETLLIRVSNWEREREGGNKWSPSLLVPFSLSTHWLGMQISSSDGGEGGEWHLIQLPLPWSSHWFTSWSPLYYIPIDFHLIPSHPPFSSLSLSSLSPLFPLRLIDHRYSILF